MASRIRIKTDRDDAVHFDSNNSYTLCGLETLGDDGVDGLGIEEGVPTTDKVTCPGCIAIVRFCKAIKSGEIVVNVSSKGR